MGSRNKLVDLERACLMSFIFSEIQSLYDSGTPFFTKDNIRKAGEELEHFRKGERENGANITMKGVNGADYQVFVRAPVSVPPSIIQIFGGEKWVIHYSSINHLTTFLHPDISLYNPQSAYLPMRISAIIRRFINYDASLYEKPPAPPADDFSTYQAFEQEWKTSQHYAQFHQILTGIEIPFALTKVIAVTLGSLTTKSQIRKNRFLQHTFVSAIHATLVRRGILSASSDKRPASMARVGRF
ncbi:hypothetical protein GGR51DRAFT_532356 [Nemania sp. FL0031]|nr:hypothetical protein GGR51DRAFT_532356 [Nemania sp. FL0031]